MSAAAKFVTDEVDWFNRVAKKVLSLTNVEDAEFRPLLHNLIGAFTGLYLTEIIRRLDPAVADRAVAVMSGILEDGSAAFEFGAEFAQDIADGRPIGARSPFIFDDVLGTSEAMF